MLEDFEPMDESESVGKPPALLGSSLSGPQKAAILIAALGPEAAGPIIERINDNHLRSFTRAFASLDTVPRSEVAAVIEEFRSIVDSSSEEIKGGFEEARALLSEFKRADEIVRLMEDIGAPSGRSVWDKLEEAPDSALAEYLGKQHPQTVAVVLSKISPDKASMVLAMAPEEMARSVILRMSKPINVNAASMAVLSETIDKEFLAPESGTKSERNPGQVLGSMLNNLPSDRRDDLMEHLGDNVPEMVPEVQKYMLTFQDFSARVPANAVAVVVREIEEEEFLKALKFGKQNAPAAVDFIMENISQRMASQYVEQLEKIAKVASKDGEAAQRAVMAAVRALDASGEIKLNEIQLENAEEE